MDELLKLANKKNKDKDMDPHYKSAKMGVLKHISDMAGEAMGKGIDNLKTVMVGSNDRKGLEEGLDKAKEIVSKGNRPLDSDEFEPMTSENEHNSSDEHEKPHKYSKGGMVGYADGGQAVADDDEQSEYTGQTKRYAEGGLAMDDDSGSDDSDEEASKPAAEHMLAQEIEHEGAEGDLSEEDIDDLIAELQAQKAKLKK